MIPVKLSLTNFMCYRQALVDLTGIHVTCLSGENGAGKSALLDAMTWALWGKARARRDDELIYLGQKEMEADLIFQLGSDCYRAVRKRKAGKRGRSLLDFQIQDEDHWRSIAESSIRDTQAKIERVLGLDYDTFVNSAFLRQGRADEFTIKPPAERKRVLGEILGLNIWETYEERVKDRLRVVQDEARALDLRLTEIEQELDRRSEYETQVETARKEAEASSAALQKAQKIWQTLEKARTELRHVQTQQEELADRIAQAQREQAGAIQEQQERETRLAQYRELVAQEKEIESGYTAYQEAVEQERVLGEKLLALSELNEKRSQLEAEVAQARHDLEMQRGRAAQRVVELEARLPPPELLQEVEQVRIEADHLRQLAQSQEDARVDLAQLAEERAGILVQNELLKSEMDALRERIQLLEQAEADCPLCNQPLAADDQHRLLEELQERGTQKGDLYRANRDRLDEISSTVEGLETQIAQSESLLQKLPELERAAATLEERVRAGEEVIEPLENTRAELQQVEAELAAEVYAPQVREALATVLAQATQLGYQAEAHQAARQAVDQGRLFAERKTQLETARTGTEQEEKAMARLQEAVQRWQEQVKTDQDRQSELSKEQTGLEKQLEDSQQVEQELAQVRIAETEARQRLGAAQQRLAAIEALAQQQSSRRQRRDELAGLQSLYQELRTAFGVQGVPAMMIEAVVPEIEDEANRLLRQLTAGRMHVRLETQRETQAGQVRETLDIRIMDELGERPYENYSGGEQFRVNFALRIALSRLLARRAGAQLSTLVIDEGFGTQDAQGRERLVEAIHTIQDEFSLIMVITHIEELRDVFPVRIEVTKVPSGSVVELV